MWFRGSISLILSPFLRVFSISGFLKVIHALQTPQKRCESGTSKINFLHSVLQILAIGTCHGPYKHPHAKGWLSNWWKSWEKKNLEKKILKKNSCNFFFFQNFSKFFFQDFHYLDKKPLTWGCLYTLWEVPIARIWKNICRKVIFGVPEMGGFGGVDDL